MTVISRVLESPAITSKARRHLAELLDDSIAPPAQLAEEISSYTTGLQQTAETHEFIDLETAILVGRICGELVSHLDTSTPEDHHRLIQAAARYFVLSNDAEDDVNSPIGFDDDLKVACAVARALELEDIVKICQER